jgi:hypothetical protein
LRASWREFVPGKDTPLARRQDRRHRLDDDQEQLLMSHTKAQRVLDVGNSKYWGLVKNGIIETVQLGATSMATYASVKRAATPSE